VSARRDLTAWALRVPLPRSAQIGTDRVGRVLVALVQYADATGMAWPSADLLAADVSGITRRDARNALDLLAEAGLIRAAEERKRGRALRWRILADTAITDHLAGIPATSDRESEPEMAGVPASSPVPELAGELAGNMAGSLAGIPAMKGSEGKNPPAPEAADRHAVAQHEREPDALRALATLVQDRRLPLRAADLLPDAYRLGAGDPWAGYLEVKRRTVKSLEDATSPTGLLRYWLREPAQPSRATASTPPHVRTASSGMCSQRGHEEYPLVGGRCDRCAREQETAA
jgi:hypothetical protein